MRCYQNQRPGTNVRNIRTVGFRLILLSVLLTVFSSSLEANENRKEVSVTEVLSGDVVRLSNGQLFRYLGPECYQPQSKILLEREYGKAALDFNKALIADQKLFVEWDMQIRDKSGNLLGYLFLEDGTFVNLEIIKAGHAKARVYAPNVKYREELRAAEKAARKARLGIWQAEPKGFEVEKEVVGNVNTKIWYYTDSPELDRVPQAHLRKFRSRIDALAAGFKACPSCKESTADQGSY